MQTFDRLWRSQRGLVGGLVVALILAVGTLAPAIAPYSYSTQSLLTRLEKPSAAHRLGTARFGRDILTRVIWGGRVSLEIGLLATGLSVIVGTVLGGIAAYFGGAVDTAIMRVADMFMAIPALFLILVVVALFGAGLTNTAAVIGLVTWAQVARIVRGECLSLRARALVDAARARGQPPAYPRAPRARQRAPRHHRAGDSPSRPDHPHRVGPVIPRTRRPATAAELGQHDRGGATIPRLRLVGGHLSRRGDLRDRLGIQSVRRRPGRRARAPSSRGRLTGHHEPMSSGRRHVHATPGSSPCPREPPRRAPRRRRALSRARGGQGDGHRLSRRCDVAQPARGDRRAVVHCRVADVRQPARVGPEPERPPPPRRIVGSLARRPDVHVQAQEGCPVARRQALHRPRRRCHLF